MPRFVILRHDLSDRGLHWDFMLEFGDTLLTWALEREPAYEIEILANQLTNHRLEYLNYEGPVSAGRGTVSRFDSGDFRWHKNAEKEVLVHLNGEILRGTASLQRMADTDQRWLIRFSDESSSED